MHTVDTMSSNLKLRVHIAPVGFEIDRIVIPAKTMRADKVCLIADSNRSADKARPFLEKVRKTLDKVSKYVMVLAYLFNVVNLKFMNK